MSLVDKSINVFMLPSILSHNNTLMFMVNAEEIKIIIFIKDLSLEEMKDYISNGRT